MAHTGSFCAGELNAGIAGGSLAGGFLLTRYGPRPTALLGGLMTLMALFLASAPIRPRRDQHCGVAPSEG